MISKCIFAFILACSFSISLTQYIQVRTPSCNIFVSPFLDSEILVCAKKGDVFETLSQDKRWFGIRVFSGETRYLEKKHARRSSYSPSIPKQNLAKKVFNSLLYVESLAIADAKDVYPDYGNGAFMKSNYIRQITLRHFLDDKYKYEVFKKNQLHCPDYDGIISIGVQHNWHLK